MAGRGESKLSASGIAIGLLLVALLAGCGDAEEEAPTQPTPPEVEVPSADPPAKPVPVAPTPPVQPEPPPTEPAPEPEQPVDDSPFGQIHHEDPDYRSDAVGDLADLGTPAAVDAIREAVYEEPDPELRIEMLEVLVEQEAPRTLDTLLYLLSDPSSEVREAAADGLDSLEDDRAVPGLYARLRGEPDPYVREAIMSTLISLDPEFDEELFEEDE